MRTLLIAFGLVALGLVGALVPATNAATDYFLHIDGIPGEAPADPHKDWIELISFDGGVTNSPGTNQPLSAEFTLTKRIDKASPKLMLACAQGQLLNKVVLEYIQPGTNGLVKFCRIEMKNVYVSSYSQPAPPDSSTEATEIVQLSAEQFTFKYVQFDANDRPVDEITVYWDYLRNEGGIIPIFKLAVHREGDGIHLTWPGRNGQTYKVRGSATVNGVYAVDATITATETGPLSTTIPITSPHRFFLIEELP